MRAAPCGNKKKQPGGIPLGIGVADIKVNHVETPEQIAGIEAAEKVLGPGRVRFIHHDCGFWML